MLLLASTVVSIWGEGEREREKRGSEGVGDRERGRDGVGEREVRDRGTAGAAGVGPDE